MKSKIVKYLMDSYGFAGDSINRNIVISACHGYYGDVSALILEVEGSPVRGRAIVSRIDCSSINLGNWKVSIETQSGWKTLPRIYDSIKKTDKSWTAKIVTFALDSLSNESSNLKEENYQLRVAASSVIATIPKCLTETHQGQMMAIRTAIKNFQEVLNNFGKKNRRKF